MLRITVVTPVYNSERYIEETMLSIISQSGNFELEYIIVDGGSTDSTNGIIDKYERLVNGKMYDVRCADIKIVHISEKDDGMYDAINKGFSIASGDIYCYLNASDLYLPGTFNTIVKIFEQTTYLWIKGNICYIDENSNIQKFEKKLLFINDYIKNGYYGLYGSFISQETMFWKNELWKKIGKIDNFYKHAGDFYLWNRFSYHTSLMPISIYTSCFRFHSNQKSSLLEKYLKECFQVVQDKVSVRWRLKGLMFKYVLQHFMKIRFLHLLVKLFLYQPSFTYLYVKNDVIKIKKTSLMIMED